jgi:hypothetical protein
MVHHAVYCLMSAFASGRMLVIDKSDKLFGLDKHFLPISSKCSMNDDIPRALDFWPTKTDSE